MIMHLIFNEYFKSNHYFFVFFNTEGCELEKLPSSLIDVADTVRILDISHNKISGLSTGHNGDLPYMPSLTRFIATRCCT
jgi:hypothetical protein